ncbi:MAG: glycosyltransferase family 2 protein [Ruminococcaceae bacterium]|nr:glycosyltransferase family 2 protein [Oscillospiraceae bacterium]
MNSLYIVIPAYNEEANITKTIEDWYPVIESHNSEGNSRLVVVNDGSKDNTYELLLQLAKTRPLLIPLTKKNGGHGSAVIFGYKYALESGASYIFQTDSDGQTDPNEFEGFWKLREQYDAVFGNRNRREDGKSRIFVEKTLCMILRLYFRVRIPDSNAPFRLMNADYLSEYFPKLPSENYNLPNVMITTFGENTR